jgi:CRP-like cAMP-binding protein
MATDAPRGPLRNHLLALLKPADYERLLPDLQLVPLPFNQPIYEAGGVIDYVYFPTQGVISAVATMEDGTSVEVATIGNEGMAGLPVFIEAELSPNRLFVQVAGEAARMPADVLRRETKSESSLRRILHLYQTAFMAQLSQSVACNGLHSVLQRCCRWLLITHDRMEDVVVPLTHELLSIMLGVRRPSVTEVLQSLQEKGFVRYGRGRIEIVDRKGLEATSCECYQSVKNQYLRLLGSAPLDHSSR